MLRLSWHLHFVAEVDRHGATIVIERKQRSYYLDLNLTVTYEYTIIFNVTKKVDRRYRKERSIKRLKSKQYCNSKRSC